MCYAGAMMTATVSAGYRTVFLLGISSTTTGATRVSKACSVNSGLTPTRIANFAAKLGLALAVQFVSLDGPGSPLSPLLQSMSLSGGYRLQGRVRIEETKGITSRMGIKCCGVDRIPYSRLKMGKYLNEYDGRKPIAMTGAMRGWRANTEWTSQFFEKNPYGQRVTEVLGIRPGAINEEGKSDLFRALYPINMTMADFARVVDTPALYGKYMFLDNNLFSMHPLLADAYINPIPPMFRENQYIPPPTGFEAGRGDTFLSFFWGAEGSRSGLHRDPWGWTSWIAVISGRKAFKLFPANMSDSLHVYPNDLDRSPVDAFNPDYAAYPKFAGIEPIEVVVGPGDVVCLMDYYHQAYNLEDTMAVSGNIINHNNVERIIFESIERGKPNVGRDLMGHVAKSDRELFLKLAGRWNKIFPPPSAQGQ